MTWLKSLYPKVRTVLDESTPDFWPGLRQVIGGLFEEPIPTEPALPLAACQRFTAVKWRNRTIIWIAGTRGEFEDNHNLNATKSYSEASLKAVQNYRYHSPCKDSGKPGQTGGPNCHPTGRFRRSPTESPS